MKKTYKAPKYKTIDLTGEAMIAQSGGEDTINTCGTDADALVKENVSSRHNLWDDEW